MNKNKLVSKHIETPIGKLLACATDKGICLLEFIDKERCSKQLKLVENKIKTQTSENAETLLNELTIQLKEYFNKKRREFTIPLDINIGTEFQRQAWEALIAIPYGITKSYKEQATYINNPKAVRAIGSANRANPISIIIPCHRVIGANGKLVGYGGGLWRKEYLIKLEKDT